CASGAMPVATATAEPPDEPAGLSAGFHGLRVGPNSVLLVLAPQANSGVLVFASTMAPAAFSRRTTSSSPLGTWRGKGGVDAGGQRDVLDPDRQAVQRAKRLALHHRLFGALGVLARVRIGER